MVVIGHPAGEPPGSPQVLRSPAAVSGDVAALPAAGSARAYRIYLLVVGLVYMFVFGGLLIWTDGLPYVMDNNESFSTVWHAQNMAT